MFPAHSQKIHILFHLLSVYLRLIYFPAKFRGVSRERGLSDSSTKGGALEEGQTPDLNVNGFISHLFPTLRRQLYFGKLEKLLLEEFKAF